ncbi:hypothetical protein QBC38DRAFT_352785 [Podospora fimiseda]|uniref:DUF718 domain protein n=1 Tax=Podospora fimiseda TaxID=252190 RepID=A0AAN7H520_9PEZI|nr:hypothetical protein QBC38DRAFT_352785 [Podospora fimiseda]
MTVTTTRPHLWEPPKDPENWISTCSCNPDPCTHNLRESSASPGPTTGGGEAGRYPGARYAQIIKLKEGFEEEYIQLHERVWRSVQLIIKECGIQDYSIFYDPDTRILFASFKYTGDDYEADMAKMRESKDVQNWWQLTDAMQESFVPGARGSVEGQPAWWKPIREVFYLS